MPLATVAAENATLQACYGNAHASTWPATFLVRLWSGDPRDDGVEVSDAGYSPQSLANTDANFTTASGRTTSVVVDFGDAAADISDVDWWSVEDSTSGVMFECCEFRRPKDFPTGSGIGARLEIAHDPEV